MKAKAYISDESKQSYILTANIFATFSDMPLKMLIFSSILTF